MLRVFVGLGSNMGRREDALLRAKTLLRQSGVRIVKESSVMQTDPVDLTDQPQFLNQIIIIETDLRAEDLLHLLLDIETTMGRIRTVDKGPRIIDLDILLYGNEIISSPLLTVPHYAIRNRRFILEHLAQLDPELTDPQDGVRYASLL